MHADSWESDSTLLPLGAGTRHMICPSIEFPKAGFREADNCSIRQFSLTANGILGKKRNPTERVSHEAFEEEITCTSVSQNGYFQSENDSAHGSQIPPGLTDPVHTLHLRLSQPS